MRVMVVVCVLMMATIVVLLIAAANERATAHSVERDAHRSTMALQKSNAALKKYEATARDSAGALLQATAALRQAQSNSSRIAAVQASRVAACKDTNTRHIASVRYLRRLYRQAEHAGTRAQRREAKAGEAAIIGVVNVMFPFHVNCVASVGPG
jgi:hypothetical protein